MSKLDQENLPSITTRGNDSGDERSSVMKEKDTAVFAREVADMMDLTRIEKGELNKIDLVSMIDKTEKIVLKKKKDVKVKKIYTRYQNLWTAFVANNNIENEYDDVVIVKLFQSIQGRYSPNTLWVINCPLLR